MDDLPATPEPWRGLHLSLALLAAVSVPVVLLTAGALLGPGVAYSDVVVLCAVYALGTVGSVLVPWHRLEERWLLALVALPVVFVAALSALTGAGNSPFSTLYAPILAIAGWHLPVRHAAAAIGLVVVTELWRAVAVDGSQSIEQLLVALPFDVALTAVAFLAGSWLRESLTNTRRDQVRMAATLDAIRELGRDPERGVLSELEKATARIFDADVRVVRFESQRPRSHELSATLVEPGATTLIVAGADRIHALVRLAARSPLSAQDQRLAAILAEAAGRTLDAREQVAETQAETERDPLTGLLNRRALDRDLLMAVERAARDGEPLSLLFIDLDRFKSLNDEFGHAAGDAVLIRLAGLMRVGARGSDAFYRFGGDEFAMIVRGGSESDGVVVGQRILGLIASPSRRSTDLPLPSFNVSIGVAELRADMQARGLLEAADRAMYVAKHAGGGVVKTADAAQQPSDARATDTGRAFAP